MSGNESLYCFKNSNEQFYGLDADGKLIVSSNPYFLKYSPDGWSNISIKNQRNKKYFGIDRMVSVPLSFVEDGAKILKSVFYGTGKGTEADIDLVILQQRLDFSPTHYGFWYKQIFRGSVDLSTWNDSLPKVTVTILEQGLPNYLKSNDATNYKIPVNQSKSIDVLNDGIDLLQSAKYFVSNGSLPNDLGHHTINLNLNSNEQVQTLGAITQERIQVSNTSQALWDSGKYFLQTGAVAQSFTFTWDFKMTVSLASGIGAIFGTGLFLKLVMLQDRDNDTRVDIDTKGGGDPLALYNIEQHFQGTYTVTVPANRRLVLVMATNNNSTFTFFNYNIDGGSFDVKYQYRYPATVQKWIRPIDLFEQLIEKVTEGKFQVDKSGVLIEEEDKVFTSGLEIRGIQNSDIEISLNDFFEFWDTYKDVGLFLTSQGKVKMDLKSRMVPVEYIHLGEVSNLSVKVAPDFKGNRLKIGYPDKQQEDLNGLEAFNNTFEWSLGATRSPKEFDKTCKVIADCYSLEITRLRFSEKTTTDSKQDSDVYVLHIQDAVNINNQYEIDRTLNASAVGLIEADSVYNLALTPGRCLRNNGSFFSSCFDGMEARYLQFQKSSKNNKLECGAPVIRERENILINSLGDKYFRPYLFEFETKGVEDLLELLDENPLRGFSFTAGGQLYKGMPEQVSIEPISKKSQTYILLADKSTDLKPLIERYG